MNRLNSTGVILLALVTLSAPAIADDLSGATLLLCSQSWATVCTADEVCESGPPWEWNIPQFVELDLTKKTISSTAASGENRTTPAELLRRENGLIVVQGVEQGRAFSVVISESTGRASGAIAAQGRSVAFFSACTPLAAGR